MSFGPSFSVRPAWRSALQRISTARTLMLGVALVLPLACSSSSPATSSNGSTVVPWVDRQGTPNSLASSVHAGRPCTAADLVIEVGRTGAFHGEATQELELRNHAADACYLAGVPQSQLADVSAQTGVDSGRFATQRVDLAAGQSALLIVGAPVGCPASANPILSAKLSMTLPNGDVMPVQGARINTECGAANVMEFNAITLPPASPGPLSNLRPAVNAPQSAARGTVLTFHVTIHNASATSIDYSPCPSYTEGISNNAGPILQRTLLLNCSAASSIGPGATLVYEMKLLLPSSMSPGATKLFWRLEVPDGQSAGAVISIA